MKKRNSTTTKVGEPFALTATKNGGPKTARRSPYVWVSWLSKILAGEVSCEFQSWFKAHFTNYEKAPSDFDQPKWMQEHTELVTGLARELRLSGHSVTLEGQNAYSYMTKGNITLGCKPDLIAIKDGEAVIWDGKTGKQRASDSLQVMLYTLTAPFACPVLEKFGGKVSGMILYGKTKDRVATPLADAAFIGRVNSLCELFAEAVPPPKSPGKDCMWCDLAKSECPERVDQKRYSAPKRGIL